MKPPFRIRKVGRSWHITRRDALGTYVFIGSWATHQQAIRDVNTRWPWWL